MANVSRRSSYGWFFPLGWICLWLSACVPEDGRPQPLDGPFDYRLGDSPRGPDGRFLWLQDDPRQDGWLRANNLASPDHHGERFFWIRLRLPDPIAGEDPSLFIPLMGPIAEVYLDGRLVARQGRIGADDRGEYMGTPWHLIPLPPGSAGRLVHFRIYCDYFIGGVVPGMRIGSSTEHIIHLLRQDIDRVALVAVFLFIFAVALALFLFEPGQRAFLWFSGMALGLALYCLGWSQYKQLLLDAPLFWVYVIYLGVYLTAPSIMLFVSELLGGGPFGAIRKIGLGLLVFLPCALIAALAGWVPILKTILPFYVLTGLGIVVATPRLIQSAWRKDRDSMLLAGGFAALILFASYDILRDLGLVPFTRPVIPWGLFALLLSGGLILALRYAKTYRLLYDYSHELESKNEELKQLDKMKTAFLTKVSHELRTPLNAIINLPDNILQGYKPCPIYRCAQCQAMFQGDNDDLPASPPRHCPSCQAEGSLASGIYHHYDGDLGDVFLAHRIIQRSGHSLLQIVNNILDMSAVEKKQAPLALSEFQASKLLSEVVELSAPAARSQGIECQITEMSDDLTLEADFPKMGQILFNLLSNAIKFSRRGQSVELGAVPDDRGICFFVRDRGIGIDPRDHALIFEPFRQVDDGINRKFGGTGLGLSVARELTTLHGGTLRVESELGQGSTFYLTVPRRQEAEETAEDPSSGTPSA